jgi:hypothetical protein
VIFIDIIGFDTETILEKDIAKFFCFTAYSEDRNIKIYSENINDLEQIFCWSNRGCKFFAHNLEFDFGVIREWLESKYELEIKFAKSRLIAIIVRYKNQTRENREKNEALFTLLDSMNFYPMSLAKVGCIVKLNKLESPDYLGKRKYETKEEQTYFKEYAMIDSIIVYKAMKLFLHTVKGNLGITLASTCMKYYKNMTNIDEWRITQWLNKDIRNSYFGGRVEAFYRGMVHKNNFDKINVYDFNSLYPSVMKLPMPDLKEYPKILYGSYDSECLGSALVHIKTECKYPIIPLRTDKLKFINGEIFGWFTIPELNSMVDSGEGKVISCKKSYNWKKTPSYFTEYIDFFYNSRIIAKTELNPQESIYKLMMNSLYGKFGEMIEPTSYRNIDSLNDFSNATEILGNYAIFKEPERQTQHTFFPIASTITAYSRLKLHDKIHDIVDRKHKEIFYCDTDSLFTNAKLETSNILGDLKLENVKDWFCFIRAKAYLSDDFVKLKGSRCGLKPEAITKCLNKNTDISIDNKRFVKFRESLRSINKNHLELEIKKKVFNTESDGKRDYFKDVVLKNLLSDCSDSKPINVTLT